VLAWAIQFSLKIKFRWYHTYGHRRIWWRSKACNKRSCILKFPCRGLRQPFHHWAHINSLLSARSALTFWFTPLRAVVVNVGCIDTPLSSMLTGVFTADRRNFYPCLALGVARVCRPSTVNSACQHCWTARVNIEDNRACNITWERKVKAVSKTTCMTTTVEMLL